VSEIDVEKLVKHAKNPAFLHSTSDILDRPGRHDMFAPNTRFIFAYSLKLRLMFWVLERDMYPAGWSLCVGASARGAEYWAAMNQCGPAGSPEIPAGGSH
jgi:hypothetical protein